MNSHDVQAGDIIFDRNGVEQRVSRVSQVYEQDAPVCNLMIEEHQNYSVGHLGILVHNTSICGREISQIMDDIGAITDVAKRQEALEYILKNAENVPRQHLDELVDAFRGRFGNVTLSQAAGDALAEAAANAASLDYRIAVHAIGQGHWPGLSVKQVLAKMQDVKDGFKHSFTIPGTTRRIYVKGQVALIEDGAGGGTIFNISPSNPNTYLKRWVRENLGL